MIEAAIILSQNPTAASARKISRLLNFFGVPCRGLTAVELFNQTTPAGGSFRVLGSVEDFLALSKELESQVEKQAWWTANVQSAFCYAENHGDPLASLVQKFKDSPKILPQSTTASNQPWNVSGQLKDFCGPFAGLVVPSKESKAANHLIEANGSVENIISNATGAAFVRVDFFGIPLFLSTSEVIDIDEPICGRVFDIHPQFLTAVPAVLYIKNEFAAICWQPAETTACMVIDDPLLRPRYGFLNYDRLLGLMERLDFSTNIAFIPWNWNRSARATVSLFEKNPRRFSLSVHGCDHTRGEYGSPDPQRLAWKSRQSLQRMTNHHQRTGLAYDAVMVFPQGIFSGAAMAALKTGDFIATVNSEVISADPQPPKITVADFWDVALMNYSDFPIFTRRYPWAGIANFAFDILLGKPCLVNIHHNDFHDQDRCVIECIEQLNWLNVRLRWTNLAEVARRSFRQRDISREQIEVEIYSNEARLENASLIKKNLRVLKRESAPDSIREIRVDGQPVKWAVADGRVTFETSLNPGANKTIVITYQPIPLDGIQDEGPVYHAKVRLRRYLSEVRDNYMMRKSFSE